MTSNKILGKTLVIALVLISASACAPAEPTTQPPQNTAPTRAATPQPQPTPKAKTPEPQIAVHDPISPFAEPAAAKTVSGTISGKDGSATITSIRNWGEEPTPDKPDGTHELLALDTSGDVIHSVRFTPLNDGFVSEPEGPAPAFGTVASSLRSRPTCRTLIASKSDKTVTL